jgi:hypothetical protein
MKSGCNLFMEQMDKTEGTALYRNTQQISDSPFICHSVHVTERQIADISCALSSCLPRDSCRILKHSGVYSAREAASNLLMWIA